MASRKYGRGGSGLTKRDDDEITEGPRSPTPIPRPDRPTRRPLPGQASDKAAEATTKATPGRGPRSTGPRPSSKPKPKPKSKRYASASAPSTAPRASKKPSRTSSGGAKSRKIPQYEKKKGKDAKRLKRSKAWLARYGGGGSRDS